MTPTPYDPYVEVFALHRVNRLGAADRTGDCVKIVATTADNTVQAVVLSQGAAADLAGAIRALLGLEEGA